MSLPERVIPNGEWESTILPALKGRVFHATRRASFDLILRSGQVSPNQDGSLVRGLSIERPSYGRLKGYVCLFDFRTATEKEIDFGLMKCHPASLGAQQTYLVLRREAYPKLIPSSRASEEGDWNPLWVPELECWYPGSIPIDEIEEAVHLTNPPPPPPRSDRPATLLDLARRFYEQSRESSQS